MPANFFDSNVVLYLADDPRKAALARELLDSGGFISTQVLNEVANVGRGKMKRSWDDVEELLTLIRSLVAVRDLTVETHETGLGLARRYRLHIYDAMIVAAALLAECDTLYSEDMQDGLVVEGRLHIKNPFRV